MTHEFPTWLYHTTGHKLGSSAMAMYIWMWNRSTIDKDGTRCFSLQTNRMTKLTGITRNGVIKALLTLMERGMIEVPGKNLMDSDEDDKSWSRMVYMRPLPVAEETIKMIRRPV